jgi:hypothetical protein
VQQYLYVFVHAALFSTNHLSVNWWDGSRWQWADLGTPPGTGVGQVLGAVSVAEHPYVFVNSTDGRLWINWWNGSSWQWQGPSGVVSPPPVMPPPPLEETKRVYLQKQPSSGPIPYVAQFPAFGTIKNGNFKSIKNLANVFNPMNMYFVKNGHSTDDCFTPDAAVVLGPQQSTTLDDNSLIYGSATPALPVGIIACVALKGSLPDSVPVDVTYTYSQ